MDRPLLTPFQSMHRFVCFALLSLVACTGRPQPEIPSLAPPDPTQIDVEVSTGSAPGSVFGRPGAVDPASQVWIAPLDQSAPHELVTPEADGSFRSSIMLFPGMSEEVRVQARMGDLRSDPVDVLIGVGEVVRATADCLSLSPELELAAGEVAVGESTPSAIVLVNACGAEVTIEMIRLRAPSTAIIVDTAQPLVVPDGGSASVDVTFRPDTPGLLEEVVILEVTAPERDRRAVTVFGTGR